jgi:hypothetical protein
MSITVPDTFFRLQLGLNVKHDGGVPIRYLPLDGNTSESPEHPENLKELRLRLSSSTRLTARL